MIEFDDVVLCSTGVYTQVCIECLSKYPEIDERFEHSPGPPPELICGVAGCYNDASYYVELVVFPSLTQEELNKLRNERFNP